MNKFMYEVSDLVKIECMNAMLLRDINIFRLMTYAQQVKGVGKIPKRTRRLGKATMTILTRNWVVEITRSLRRTLQIQHLHELVFHPPYSEIIRNVGNQDISLKVVFQPP